MLIKKLRVAESYPSDSPIREVTFKKGPNFIVDGHKKPGEKGNGIGKTTVLRVIDICLGAKDRKYLYYDEELSVTNTALRDYINEHKVYAELVLCNDIDEPESSQRYTLKVDLFERGHKYINDEAYNKDEYYAQLNEIVFENNLNSPSFRQLIGMFVRVKLKDDNNKFLKFLDNFSSNADYENIYSYLFRLSDQALNDSILRYKKKITSLTTSINQLLSINGIKSISAIEQNIIEIEKEAESLRRKIGILVNAEELKKNERDISFVRESYSKISDALDLYSFKLERVNEVLNEARRQGERPIDRDVLKNLYDDAKLHLQTISKTFDDLVDFNRQLQKNKIAYFEKQKNEIQAQISALEQEQQDLFSKYKDVVVLIRDHDVKSYVELQTEFEEKIRNIGRFQKIVELHAELTGSKNEAQSELDQLLKIPSVDVKANLSVFNGYFTPYSRLINHEPYLLYKTDSGFPLALNNVEAGLSTGTKKSAIAAFDLAYQSYAKDMNIKHPYFVIHDVIETMDEVGLTNTVKIAREIGCQYIVAVLKDKIERNEEIETQDIRLTLTKDDRFFKV